jgi:hypothetical protein
MRYLIWDFEDETAQDEQRRPKSDSKRFQNLAVKPVYPRADVQSQFS